jgi:hypothetical protein
VREGDGDSDGGARAIEGQWRGRRLREMAREGKSS